MVSPAPTPEDLARAIMSLLKLKDVRANEMLVLSQLSQPFLTNGGKATDYAEGIKYAVERGWLEPLTSNRVRLTETGFVEMGRFAGQARVTRRQPQRINFDGSRAEGQVRE